jgi:hypothetical protein
MPPPNVLTLKSDRGEPKALLRRKAKGRGTERSLCMSLHQSLSHCSHYIADTSTITTIHVSVAVCHNYHQTIRRITVKKESPSKLSNDSKNHCQNCQTIRNITVKTVKRFEESLSKKRITVKNPCNKLILQLPMYNPRIIHMSIPSKLGPDKPKG